MNRYDLPIREIAKKINLVYERYGVSLHTEGKVDIKKDKKIIPPKLILVRGLPGSGKSTFAKSMIKDSKVKMYHYEADMYFMKDKEYVFDMSKIGEAHSWCQTKTMEKLMKNETVIVSNTFSRLWEMQPYFNMGIMLDIEVEVYCMKSMYANIHNVPEEIIERMKDSWEKYEDESYIKNKEIN